MELSATLVEQPLWDSLSADILLEICSQLTSVVDIVRLGECCSHYHKCTKGSNLWRSLYSRDYNVSTITEQKEDSGPDWQKLYLQQFRTDWNMRKGQFIPTSVASEICDTVDRYGGNRIYPLTSTSQSHALVTWATGPSFRTSYSVDTVLEAELIDLTSQARTKIAEGVRGFCLVGNYVISAEWHHMYSYSGPNWNKMSVHLLDEVLQNARAGQYDWWNNPKLGHELRIMSRDEAQMAPWTRNWETALLVNVDPDYSHILGLNPSVNSSADRLLPIGVWDLRNLSQGQPPEMLFQQRFMPSRSIALVGPLLLYTTRECELCAIHLLDKDPSPVLLLSNWADIASEPAESLSIHADSYCKATREIVVSLYIARSVDDSDLAQRRLVVLRLPEPDTISRWVASKPSAIAVASEIVVADYLYTPDIAMLRVALSPNKIAFSGIFSYGVQLINVFARKGTVEPGEPSRPAEDPVEQEVLKQPMPMFPQLNIPTAILDRTKRLAEMCTGPVYSRQTIPLFYFLDDSRLVSLVGDAVVFDWRPCQAVKVAVLGHSVSAEQVPWRVMHPSSIYEMVAKQNSVSNSSGSFDIKATTVFSTEDFRAILVYYISEQSELPPNVVATRILVDHVDSYELEERWRNDPKDVKWVPTMYSPASVEVIVNAANNQDTENIPSKFRFALGTAYMYCEGLVDSKWTYADVPDRLVGANGVPLFAVAPDQASNPQN